MQWRRDVGCVWVGFRAATLVPTGYFVTSAVLRNPYPNTKSLQEREKRSKKT